MKIIKDLKDFQEITKKIRANNKKIGFIPTMGSIHEGHLSLIKESTKQGCYSIASIYVNPTQFNDSKDFLEYPKNINKDIEVLNKSKCNLLFLPSNNDIYPDGIKRKKTIFNYRNILCDKFRPGHFDGVSSVLISFFSLVKPNVAFFGEKDFQQLKIVQKLVIKNNLPIVICPCPSIRNKNGMSYSSRYNKFNLAQQSLFNKIAKKIHKTVETLKKKIDQKNIENLKSEIIKFGVKKIDYLEIRDEKNLNIVNKNKNSRLFVAFYIDEIRIIDNFILY